VYVLDWHAVREEELEVVGCQLSGLYAAESGQGKFLGVDSGASKKLFLDRFIGRGAAVGDGNAPYCRTKGWMDCLAVLARGEEDELVLGFVDDAV